jgi:transposase
MADKEVIIRITGKNLTPEAFTQARQQLGGLKKAADDTKPSMTGLRSSFDAVKKAAGLLGIGLGVGTLVTFGKRAIDLAGEVSETADRFGVSTETVQRWKFAVEQSGGSIGTLERNLLNLNKAISGGSDSTGALLGKLGLDLDDLKLMDRATAFETVADAIGRAEDPTLQMQAAVELLGRSGVENLPAFMAGLVEVGDQAPILAEKHVRALAEAGQAWKDFGEQATIISGGIIGSFMEPADFTELKQRVIDLATSGVTGAHDLAAARADATAAQLAETKAVADAAAPVTQLTDAERVHGAALIFARDATTELDASMRADIQTMLTAGATRSQVIKSLKDAEVETDQYEVAIDALIKAQKDDEKAAKERHAALEKLEAALAPVTAKESERIQIALDWFTLNGKLVVSEKDIAEAYGLSEQSIKLVISANEARAEGEEIQQKILAQISKDYRQGKEEEAAKSLEAATASARHLADLVVANKTAQGRLATDHMSTHEKIMFAIDEQEAREIAALGVRTEVNKLFYDSAKSAIEAHYQFERDTANGTASTLETRMEEQGIFTKEVLQRQAEDLRTEYEQMVTDGGYNTGQLETKWEEYETAANEATDGAYSAHKLMTEAITADAEALLFSVLRGGWGGMKEEALAQFGEIVTYFEEKFVKALIGQITGVQNSWSTAFGSIVQGFGTTAEVAAATVGTTAATASTAASTSAVASAGAASTALSSIAGALGPVAAIIWGVHKFTGGSTKLGRETKLETSSDMTDEEVEAFVGAGGNRADVTEPDGGWTYDEWAAAHGFAMGGIAEGRQLAVLAERGQREIVGSVSFMTEALIGALNRIGSGPRDGTSSGVGGGVEITLHHNTILDGRIIDQRIQRVGQRMLDGGLWTVPQASIHRRSA